ncbi:MAG: hypothetical protein PHE79_04990 [Eubacteriales bacterium]|nr:hypothetical protein [Eubacteriales bacterium]
MAAIGSTITIVGSEYRTCIVKGRKALFHRWEDKAHVYNPISIGQIPGQIKQTVGIVEYGDGTVHECYPGEIRFCDNKLREYCFGQETVDYNKPEPPVAD